MKDMKEAEANGTLQVHGHRLHLETIFKGRTLRAAKHNLEKQVPVKVSVKKQQGAPKKECKLKINRIDEVEVCNEQLKKIHETKQVSELEKLLQIHTSNVHSAEELESFDIDVSRYGKLYEELFNQYYKELKLWDASDEVL